MTSRNLLARINWARVARWAATAMLVWGTIYLVSLVLVTSHH